MRPQTTINETTLTRVTFASAKIGDSLVTLDGFSPSIRRELGEVASVETARNAQGNEYRTAIILASGERLTHRGWGHKRLWKR